MDSKQPLSGVFVASVTPLREDYSLDLEGVIPLLDFLAQRGAHGALLMGTTGEGPSFAPQERLEMLRVALSVREKWPQFRLLLGCGTPSLEETIFLTRSAFELGVDGVVVLPPYYFRRVSDEGLFAWYREVLRRAVPQDGAFLGYHIPGITGIPLSVNLLKRLREAFPQQFLGIKDSSAEAEQARLFGEYFGGDLLVFNGTDSLFALALEHKAVGCITALANLASPELRRVWDGFHGGAPDNAAQQRLSAARAVLSRYPPNPPLYKALLARLFAFPYWTVRPPLMPLPAGVVEQILRELETEVPGFLENILC